MSKSVIGAYGDWAAALNTSELPTHQHELRAAPSDGNAPVPTNNALAAFNNGYVSGNASLAIDPTTVGSAGGQGHENMQPYLALNYCIALRGLFPSRN